MSAAVAWLLLPLLLLAEPVAPSSPCDDATPGPVIESPHDPAALAQWLRSVRHRVHAKWIVPRSVREGETGTVVLRLSVGRRGQLRGLETLCASGDRALEKASRRALKAASPLTPLPEGHAGDGLVLRWRFHYQWNASPQDETEYPAERWVR